MSAELAKALVRAQGSFPPIARTREVEVTSKKTGAKYRFKYAPLEDVLSAVQKPLAENGLAISQLLSTLPGEPPLPALRTILLHESGETLSSEVPLPTSGHDTPQELGSVITYLRRYAVVSLLGIATEEDDDGNAASGNTVKSAAGGTPQASEPGPPAAEPNPAEKAQAAAERRRAENAPQDDGKPENVRIHFGKNGPSEENPQGTRLGDLTKRQLSWYANEWDPDKDPKYPSTPKDRRLKLAAQLVNTGGGTAEELMRALEADSLPF